MENEEIAILATFADVTVETVMQMLDNEDWNIWRNSFEEKVMENSYLFVRMALNIVSHVKGGAKDAEMLHYYMKADLPTRCRAVIAALDSLNPSSSE